MGGCFAVLLTTPTGQNEVFAQTKSMFEPRLILIYMHWYLHLNQNVVLFGGSLVLQKKTWNLYSNLTVTSVRTKALVISYTSQRTLQIIP